MHARWTLTARISLIGALLAAGCATNVPTAPSGALGSAPAPTLVLSAMETAIRDEYHAEWVYRGVVGDFSDAQPFQNILSAEQRHSTAIAQLYMNRGLSIPQSRWSLDNVTRFQSVREACAAAAQAEVDNIAMYDGFLTIDLPSDVRQVFENNRAASHENHLPAFERCQ